MKWVYVEMTDLSKALGTIKLCGKTSFHHLSAGQNIQKYLKFTFNDNQIIVLTALTDLYDAALIT